LDCAGKIKHDNHELDTAATKLKIKSLTYDIKYHDSSTKTFWWNRSKINWQWPLVFGLGMPFAARAALLTEDFNYYPPTARQRSGLIHHHFGHNGLGGDQLEHRFCVSHLSTNQDS